jgi:hypothetical protein
MHVPVCASEIIGTYAGRMVLKWAAAGPSPVLDGRRRWTRYPQCLRLIGSGRLVEFFKRSIDSCLSGGILTADPTADRVSG